MASWAWTRRHIVGFGAGRRAREAALRESRAVADDLRLLAEEVPAAVFRCDRDGTVTFGNARWDELLAGPPPVRVQDAVAAGARGGLDDALARLVAPGGCNPIALELPAVDGIRTFALRLRSADDRIVGSVEDVTATVCREDGHDELTGLLDRQGLEDRLGEALAEDPAGTLLVLFALDGLQGIDDGPGPEAGARALQEMAARLARAVRPTDTVSRYGGDEFALVCTGVVDDGTDEGTAAIVERLHLVLAAPVLLAGGVWQPVAGLGMARAEPGDDAATLVRRAEWAMVEAKRARDHSR